MTNRTCPIGYFDCHSCEHWQDLECCHKDALCPVCGMNMSGWEEMTGETAHAHIETHRVSHLPFYSPAELKPRNYSV